PYVLVECAPSPATHLLCAGALLLEAAVFLRMIAIFPAAEWLYPVVGALAGAVYLAAFDGAPARRLLVAALAAAFILWGLGAAARLAARKRPLLKPGRGRAPGLAVYRPPGALAARGHGAGEPLGACGPGPLAVRTPSLPSAGRRGGRLCRGGGPVVARVLLGE